MARVSKSNMEKNATKLLEDLGYTLIPKSSMRCISCGDIKTINGSGGDFYMSNSPKYKSNKAYCTPYGWNESKAKKRNEKQPEWKTYVPYCKKCLAKDLDWTDINTVLDTLRMLDKPYIKSLYDSVIDKYLEAKTTPMAMLGHYIRMVAMKHGDHYFKDSDNWTEKEIEVDDNIQQIALSNEDIYRLKKEWGNRPSEDLIYLENEYVDWEMKYDLDTKSIRFLVKQICNLQLTIQKKIEKNEDVQKELKSIQDLMASSALKPVQESAAMSAEYNTLGTWIKKFENDKPFSGVLEEYKDVDGLQKLIRVFFLGHMCKMLNVQGDISEEYESEMSKYAVSVDEECDYVD